VDSGRQLRERARPRHPGARRRASDRDLLRGLYRRHQGRHLGIGLVDHRPSDRRAHRIARGGRFHHRGRHRTYPSRGRIPAQGQEGPGHPHRDGDRRHNPPDRIGRDHRGAEVHGPRQDRDQFRHGDQGALRLRGQQSPVLVQPDRVRQRPLHHRAAAQDGGHQHRSRGGPDRSGLLRFAGHQLLFRHRRPSRLQPGRRSVGRRPRHHRAPVHCQGRDCVTHRPGAEARRGGGDDKRSGPLRGDRIRGRVSAWQQRAGAGDGAHHHRPPGLQRGAARQGDRVQVGAS